MGHSQMETEVVLWQRRTFHDLDLFGCRGARLGGADGDRGDLNLDLWGSVYADEKKSKQKL